jgi:serine acetyltransferase
MSVQASQAAAHPAPSHRAAPESALGRFLALPWLEKMQRVGEYYWLLKSQYYYRLFWGSMGRGSKLIQPMRLRNVHNIHVGDSVIINKHAFLLTLQADERVTPRMTFGDGCVIGHMNHITCVREVAIGANVLTADRVHISDHSHGFADISVPVLAQGVVSKGPVRIGDGTWIGENVSIMSCSIGRNCVIGSNAVVTRDIPDYSVAVGAPARVVKRFNTAAGLWESV